MKDIIIKVSKETRMVNCLKGFIGNDGENLQGNLVFKFEDEFVNGVARLEYIIEDEKRYAMLEEKEESYLIPIRSVLTKEGQINMQLVITESEKEEGIPIFKSNVFYVYCSKSINAEIEEPEEYPTWIEVANAKLAEINDAIDIVNTMDIDAEKVGETATVTVTKKDGSIKSVEIHDGHEGKDALINGVNTLTISEGANIKLHQEGNVLTISSESGYDDTEIRQEINNLDIEVDGLTNNINEIVRTKADKSEIPDVSEFVKRTANNLANYYLKSETYTQSEVNQMIGAIKSVSMKIVPERPATGETNIIYLVPSAKSTAENIYDEYIYVNDKWELIGSTAIDLTNYYTKEEINTLLFDYVTSNDLEETLKDYLTLNTFNDAKYNYVKDGIVNNTNALSDSEKLKIETWLGLDENYLTYYNEIPYQVNDDYVPAHKKYVDEKDTALKEKIDEIELFKFPNTTIFGTPTIVHGQVSDFSTQDYMEFPFLVDFRGRPFEINFAFTTGTDIDNQQNILDSDFGLAFAIRNKHLVLALSFNGTNWATEQTGAVILQPQTTYRIKITWNRLLYKIQYSIDGGNTYIDDINFGGTQAPYPKQMYIGIGKLAQNYFKGIINLNYANVKINGELIWQGMDDVGLQTRLATDMENIDEAGIEKIKEIMSPSQKEQDDAISQVALLTPHKTATGVDTMEYSDAMQVNLVETKINGNVDTSPKNIFDFPDSLRGYAVINNDGTLTVNNTTNYAYGGGRRTVTGTLPQGVYTLRNYLGTLLYIQKTGTSDYSSGVQVGATKTFEYDGTSFLSFKYLDHPAHTELTYKVQLEAGNVATDYEKPFNTGDPENPKEVKALTGTVVKRNYKNDVNIPDQKVSSDAVNYWVENIKGGAMYTAIITKTRIEGMPISNQQVYMFGNLASYANTVRLEEHRPPYVDLPSGTQTTKYSFETNGRATRLLLNIANSNSDSNINTLVSNVVIVEGDYSEERQEIELGDIKLLPKDFIKINFVGKTVVEKHMKYFEIPAGSRSVTIDDMVSNGEIVSQIGGTVTNKVITFTSEAREGTYLYYESLTPEIIKLQDVKPIIPLVGKNMVKVESDMKPTHIEDSYSYDFIGEINSKIDSANIALQSLDTGEGVE